MKKEYKPNRPYPDEYSLKEYVNSSVGYIKNLETMIEKTKQEGKLLINMEYLETKYSSGYSLYLSKHDAISIINKNIIRHKREVWEDVKNEHTPINEIFLAAYKIHNYNFDSIENIESKLSMDRLYDLCLVLYKIKKEE